MERFNSIYLFTTENIAGYFKTLDLTNKKIISVTSSSDHIINAILNGCKDITTFDINLLAKYYMDLKLALIKYLNYDDFISFLLKESNQNFDINIIKKLKMSTSSKRFWLNELSKYDNNGIKLKHSSLFNLKYYNEFDKTKFNLYLTKKNYDIIKNNLDNVRIRFINKNITELNINVHYDYMFLSNISDYISNIYNDNYLEKYSLLINKYSKYVDHLYFAYVYDIDKKVYRTDIDDITKVKKYFKNIKIKKVSTALLNESNKYDAVYIKEG